jgi:hypothetical protein
MEVAVAMTEKIGVKITWSFYKLPGFRKEEIGCGWVPCKECEKENQKEYCKHMEEEKREKKVQLPIEFTEGEWNKLMELTDKFGFRTVDEYIEHILTGALEQK